MLIIGIFDNWKCNFLLCSHISIFMHNNEGRSVFLNIDRTSVGMFSLYSYLPRWETSNIYTKLVHSTSTADCGCQLEVLVNRNWTWTSMYTHWKCTLNCNKLVESSRDFMQKKIHEIIFFSDRSLSFVTGVGVFFLIRVPKAPWNHLEICETNKINAYIFFVLHFTVLSLTIFKENYWHLLRMLLRPTTYWNWWETLLEILFRYNHTTVTKVLQNGTFEIFCWSLNYPWNTLEFPHLICVETLNFPHLRYVGTLDFPHLRCVDTLDFHHLKYVDTLDFPH